MCVSASEAPEVDPDRLWFIHGRAYDLNPFVSRHPGEDAALLLL
jgi:cytochrome b involved in lipid metabolism